MEVTINYNGQAVAVEVTLEVYEFLDRADHKTENLFHEQRRHWDGHASSAAAIIFISRISYDLHMFPEPLIKQ